MKYLKKFNESITYPTDPSEIESILTKIAPVGFGWNIALKDRITIQSDGTVDVEGDIKIYYSSGGMIPIKFGVVTGEFCISEYFTNLKSLVGSPHTCGSFTLQERKLTSLEGGPKYVSENYSIYGCKNITSLEGGPETVQNLCIAYSGVTSLEGSPRTISGELDCRGCPIEDLRGAPESIYGFFDLTDMPKLISLEGFPNYVEYLSFQLSWSGRGGDPSRLFWDPTPLKGKQILSILFFHTKDNSESYPGLHELMELFNPYDLECEMLDEEQLKEVTKNFLDSLDYNYVKGDFREPLIDLFRLKEALAEFDITLPVWFDRSDTRSPKRKLIRNRQLRNYTFVDEDGKFTLWS